MKKSVVETLKSKNLVEILDEEIVPGLDGSKLWQQQVSYKVLGKLVIHDFSIFIKGEIGILSRRYTKDDKLAYVWRIRFDLRGSMSGDSFIFSKEVYATEKEAEIACRTFYKREVSKTISVDLR